MIDALRQLQGLTQTGTEKMSTALKKIGMLESAFDEFLESAQEQPASEPADNEDKLAVFFEKFIPVLDNLRFLKRAVESSGDEQWKKGMVMFYEKLFSLFRDFGIETAAEIGMPFDAARHEAAETVANPDLRPGTIADILLDGWMYNGRLLRFARVVVARDYEN
jgi:molecular chaperone GrpE (heat shock protein)